MSGRMRVLAIVWAGAFVFQALPAMRECAASAGPGAALDLAARSLLTWAVPATVLTVVFGVVWFLAVPEPPPDDPTVDSPSAP